MLCPVTIFTTFPRCFDSSKRKIYSIKRPDASHNHRVQNANKEGDTKEEEIFSLQEENPRFRNLPRPFASSRGESR